MHQVRSRREWFRPRPLAVALAATLMVGSAPVTAATIGHPSFPIRAAVSMGIQLVPSASGLYVVVPRWRGNSADTAIAALDGGHLRPGWPILLADMCWLVPSDIDASVRVICAQRAFAFDRTGRVMPGWPVFVGGAATSVWDAVVVNGELVALTRNATGARLVRVSADGKVRSGFRLAIREGPRSGCGGCEARVGAMGVAPDGTGYLVTYLMVPGGEGDNADRVIGTEITMLDLAGVRPGWPVRLDPVASAPVFGPGGRIYVTQGTGDRAPTYILVLDREGHRIAGASARLPIELPMDGNSWMDGEGTWSVVAPLVADDGSSVVMPITDAGTTAYRVDASGRFRPGWTYRSPAVIESVWTDPCSIPSWAVRTSPALAADGTLYVLRHAASARVGGSVVAITLNGELKRGWPIVLRRPGAEFWSVSEGPDGTAYLLAVEPPARSTKPDECYEPYASYSGTVLAVGSDGVVRNRITVVLP